MELGLYYGKCASQWASKFSFQEIFNNDLQYFEIYYRNLGVLYEKYDLANGKKFENAENIFKQYSTAFHCIAKAYVYVILLKWAGNKKACDEFQEQPSEYLSKIDEAMKKINTLGITDKDDYKVQLTYLLKFVKNISALSENFV